MIEQKKRGGVRKGAGRKKTTETTTQFRCTFAEKLRWEEAAKKENKSLSDWIISRLG